MIAATQSFRRLIGRVLIGLLVFAQLSVAAYACPSVSGTVPHHPGSLSSLAAAAMEADGRGADGAAHDLHSNENHGYAAMDPASPNLCMGHCQAGNQTADSTPGPTLSPALVTVMYTLPPAEEAMLVRVRRTNLLLGGPPGPGEPPHAILHCCLRD